MTQSYDANKPLRPLGRDYGRWQVCTDRFGLETGARDRLAAIRHRFDWLVTGQIVQPDPAAWCAAPVATTSTRRGEPILAFDDGGARSIADAHDDPALCESLHAGAILQSIFAAAGMIDNNGWGVCHGSA
ncbi:hypothetical protein F6X42_40930 [Paraburkholderia sp. WC7.3b]|uniref:Uncharacterized protein n=1 Tax=Paraburkholderia podalyriae TaxID=1938811 RepID=A0ABR7Q1V2_9BURK|nr:hypothetical protein [Paraburkholderia podalyriae]